MICHGDVMKRTQLKDSARNIRRQFVSWLSVIIIACLAVSAYLGIRFSADALLSNADRFYDETGFRDVEILSFLGFNEADLDALRASEGVQEVVGVRSVETTLTQGDLEQGVTVTSISETINKPHLISGAFPADATECLIESDIATSLSLSIGDQIQLPQSDYLAQTRFTITGIVTHPDHIASPEDVPGNRYVLVPMAAFSEEAFDSCYTSAEIVFDRPEGISRYSEEYFTIVDSYEEALETLGKTQVHARHQQLVDRAQDAIDENQALLDDADAELKDARAQLDENHQLLAEKEAELEEAHAQLEASKAELKDARKELDDAKKELDDASQVLDDAQAQLETAASELASARTELSQGYEKMLDQREKLQNYVDQNLKTYYPGKAPKIKWATSRYYDIESSHLTMRWVPITKSDYIDLTWDIKGQVVDILVSYATDAGASKAEIKEARSAAKLVLKSYSTSSFEAECEQWQIGHDAYISNRDLYYASLAEYEEGRAEYDANYAEYEAGEEEYAKGEKKYKKAVKKYNQAVEELEAARAELEGKESEYEEGVTSYEEGAAEIEDARRQMEDIPQNRWVFLGVKGNPSYLLVRSLSDNFSNISSTFSLLFVFIGALVIYATVSKIIEEQRTLVGTTKALGFHKREIFAKYLNFGMSATLIGCGAGILFAYYVLEKTILRLQMGYFRIGEGTPVFEKIPVAIVLGIAAILSFLAVYLACRRLVRMPARQLLQGSMPGRRRRIKKRASHGLLYPRLILRNMRTDLKRVIVTIVSIAGSCALMVIGLTINHSMSSAIDIQFEQIYRYDYLLDYDSDANPQAASQVQAILDRAGAEYINVSSHTRYFQNGDDLDSTSLLVGDPAELAEYTQFTDRVTGEPMALSDGGVYIPAKLEEQGQFVESGLLTIYGDSMEPYDVPVSDAFTCYIGRYLVMSEDGYRQAFGEAPVYNEYQIRLDPAAAENIRAELEAIPGVQSFTHSDERRSNFDSMISIAKVVVVLLTAMAFIMAYFILLNLVNMYVNQKKRELVVMRVNGFTVRETKNYVWRELQLTTILGILLGIAAGAYLAHYIILLLEGINCFDRTIYPTGWGIAAGITAIFSMVISMMALHKVRDLKLRDMF